MALDPSHSLIERRSACNVKSPKGRERIGSMVATAALTLERQVVAITATDHSLPGAYAPFSVGPDVWTSGYRNHLPAGCPSSLQVSLGSFQTAYRLDHVFLAQDVGQA